MADDGFDPCECTWSHEMAMRRLLSIVISADEFEEMKKSGKIILKPYDGKKGEIIESTESVVHPPQLQLEMKEPSTTISAKPLTIKTIDLATFSKSAPPTSGAPNESPVNANRNPSTSNSLPLSHPCQHPSTSYASLENKKVSWTREATRALLTAYENRNISNDKTKRNKYFWQKVAEDVNFACNLPFELNGDQVRWKFCAIKKSYRMKKDHNRRSGNERKDFCEFEVRLASIIGDKSAGNSDNFTFNSPLQSSKIDNASDNKTKASTYNNDSQPGCSSSNQVTPPSAAAPNTSEELLRKLVRDRNGTPSKRAKARLELKKQWLLHLQKQSDRANVRMKHEEKILRQREEMMKLMKEKHELKKKELQDKSLSMRLKMVRHNARIAIEREKCDLLKELLLQKNTMSSQ